MWCAAHSIVSSAGRHSLPRCNTLHCVRWREEHSQVWPFGWSLGFITLYLQAVGLKMWFVHVSHSSNFLFLQTENKMIKIWGTGTFFFPVKVRKISKMKPRSITFKWQGCSGKTHLTCEIPLPRQHNQYVSSWFYWETRKRAFDLIGQLQLCVFYKAQRSSPGAESARGHEAPQQSARASPSRKHLLLTEDRGECRFLECCEYSISESLQVCSSSREWKRFLEIGQREEIF